MYWLVLQQDWYPVLQVVLPLELGAAAATATRAATGRRVARRENIFNSGVGFWRAEELGAEDE